MSLTNAERQANYKQKREDLMNSLSAQNESLIAENARLQAEVKALIEKCHRFEIAALKAQIKK
jgi:predicted nuclease with TOPRIM domain